MNLYIITPPPPPQSHVPYYHIFDHILSPHSQPHFSMGPCHVSIAIDREIGRINSKLKACEEHISQLLKMQTRTRAQVTPLHPAT